MPARNSLSAAYDFLARGAFPRDPAGYARLHDWLTANGPVVGVGVEGTGSYGAGIARFLGARDIAVHEVTRPERSTRRRIGKSDTIDAEAAARETAQAELAKARKDLERLFRTLDQRIAFLMHGGPVAEVDPKLPPVDSGIETPCHFFAIAVSTISFTQRLCPRWMISAPLLCIMRRMILMAASCPSKRLAAVTILTLLKGVVLI